MVHGVQSVFYSVLYFLYNLYTVCSTFFYRDDDDDDDDDECYFCMQKNGMYVHIVMCPCRKLCLNTFPSCRSLR